MTLPQAPSGGACSQATSFLARTSGLDGTHTSAYTTMICGLVTDGVWSKLDVLYFLGTQDATTAGLNLISSSFTITTHGSPNFSADNGYLGVDGSTTVYLDTGLNPATAGGNYTKDTGSIGAWSFTNAESANAILGLDDGVATAAQILPRWTGGIFYGYINTYFATSDVTAVNSSGLFVANRPDSATQDIYRNGSALNSTAFSSVSLPSVNMYVLARNSSGSANLGIGYRVGMAFVGGGLTATDISNLYSRGCTFFTAVRGSC